MANWVSGTSVLIMKAVLVLSDSFFEWDKVFFLLSA